LTPCPIAPVSNWTFRGPQPTRSCGFCQVAVSTHPENWTRSGHEIGHDLDLRQPRQGILGADRKVVRCDHGAVAVALFAVFGSDTSLPAGHAFMPVVPAIRVTSACPVTAK